MKLNVAGFSGALASTSADHDAQVVELAKVLLLEGYAPSINGRQVQLWDDASGQRVVYARTYEEVR